MDRVQSYRIVASQEYSSLARQTMSDEPFYSANRKPPPPPMPTPGERLWTVRKATNTQIAEVRTHAEAGVELQLLMNGDGSSVIAIRHGRKRLRKRTRVDSASRPKAGLRKAGRDGRNQDSRADDRNVEPQVNVLSRKLKSSTCRSCTKARSIGSWRRRDEVISRAIRLIGTRAICVRNAGKTALSNPPDSCRVAQSKARSVAPRWLGHANISTRSRYWRASHGGLKHDVQRLEDHRRELTNSRSRNKAQQEKRRGARQDSHTVRTPTESDDAIGTVENPSKLLN
jgi:hypothetical protein